MARQGTRVVVQRYRVHRSPAPGRARGRLREEELHVGDGDVGVLLVDGGLHVRDGRGGRVEPPANHAERAVRVRRRYTARAEAIAAARVALLTRRCVAMGGLPLRRMWRFFGFGGVAMARLIPLPSSRGLNGEKPAMVQSATGWRVVVTKG